MENVHKRGKNITTLPHKQVAAHGLGIQGFKFPFYQQQSDHNKPLLKHEMLSLVSLLHAIPTYHDSYVSCCWPARSVHLLKISSCTAN